MRFYVVVAALVAVAFSGCLGGDAPDLEAVGASLLDDARTSLGEDAVLYAISGLEPSELIPAEETDGCGSYPKDESPGDGRARAWFYFFAVPATGDGLVIVTDDKDKVRCNMEESLAAEIDAGLLPLGSWNVTSVTAAKTIADNVEGFATVVEAAPVFMNLARSTEGPIWSLSVLDMQTFDMLAWAVHAGSGEFLGDAFEFGLPYEEIPAVPFPEGGTTSGSTTGTAAAVLASRAPFSVASSGHGLLDLFVESADPLAELGQSYEVQVHDPSGSMMSTMVANGDVISFSAPAAGGYEVAVFPVLAGADMDFTVTFCAYTDMHCDALAPAPEEAGRAFALPLWTD